MDASVVVCTYNRERLLGLTLESLTRQTSRDRFEVIVADDGSVDGTRDVASRFERSLELRYRYQEDRGFRAAAARNLGAADARGDVLVFLDAGIVATSTLVAAHVAAQRHRPSAVVGYVHGYDSSTPERPYGESVDDPDATAAAPDMREPVYAEVGDALESEPAPWALFWTANVSVPRRAFADAGGFDEEFVGWGVEDIELGYRLHRAGLPIRLERAAAALDTAHERDRAANEASHRRNATLFFAKHRTPVVELFSVSTPARINREYREVEAALRTRRATRDPAPLEPADVQRVAGAIRAGGALLVGCDDETLVRSWRLGPAIEADAEIARAAACWNPRLCVEHALGVRMLLPERHFDAVLLTETLTALPQRHVDRILAESRRVADRVYRLAGGDEPPVGPVLATTSAGSRLTLLADRRADPALLRPEPNR